MKARLPAGYGPQSQADMLKKVQKMQQDMENMQAELDEREFSATSGGGAVSVVVTGKKEVKSIKISPEVIDADDIEILEDLIISATNEALRQAETVINEEMGKISGGINIPGLF